MAVILAYGSPALGHVYPLSALLVELARRGHQVHLRTMAGQIDAMRAAGLHADAVDPRIEAIDGQDWLARNALGVLKRSTDVLCRRAVIEVGDYRGAVEQVRPDATIIDANCWGAISAADVGDVPWCVFSPFTPYLRSRYAPPFGPGLRPLPGIVGAVRDTMMRPIVCYLFDRRIMPRINAIRAGLHARPGRLRGRTDAAGTAAVGGRRRAVRVFAPRLAGHRALHRRLCRRAGSDAGPGVAGRDRPPDRAGGHVLDRPGRRAARTHCAAGAGRSASARRRHLPGRHTPGAAPHTQLDGVPVCTA